MNFTNSLKSEWVRITDRQRWLRLDSAIKAYRNELPCLQAKNGNKCSDAVMKLLDQADAALKSGEIDQGWKMFHAARRMEILECENQEALEAVAEVICHEAEKLKGWRRDAVLQLISNRIESAKIENVYHAALLRDEHYNNTEYKNRLLRHHIITLAAILLLLLITLVLLILSNPTQFSVESVALEKLEPNLLAGILLFGFLGGTVSAVFSVPKSTESQKIPELTTTNWLTMLRLVVGAASALVVTIFMLSGFAGDLFSGVLSDSLKNQLQQPPTYFTIYVVAFLSGFTEKLVLRAVNLVAGK